MAIAEKTWQGIGWHHVRCSIPGDWEVTSYAVEERAGRLEFGTRLGLMATVSWEPCLREPDRKTTLLTFLRNNVLGKEHGRHFEADAMETADIGKFLCGWVKEGGGPVQALAYSAEQKTIVRWIFEEQRSTGIPACARRISTKLDAQARMPVLHSILDTFDFNDDADTVDYRLFGICATLPRVYKLETIVTNPANVMMAFECETDKRCATFRRWGLPDMLLGTKTLAAFYEEILRTGGCAVQATAPATVAECEAVVCTYDAPREHHADKFMSRRWKDGQAVIWHQRQERRLYTFEQIGPEKSDKLDFEKVTGMSLRLSSTAFDCPRGQSEQSKI